MPRVDQLAPPQSTFDGALQHGAGVVANRPKSLAAGVIVRSPAMQKTCHGESCCDACTVAVRICEMAVDNVVMRDQTPANQGLPVSGGHTA
jgi:hypothetical protein